MELRRGSEAWLNAARDSRRCIRQESSARQTKLQRFINTYCTEEDCIGKYIPIEQRTRILHPKKEGADTKYKVYSILLYGTAGYFTVLHGTA